MKKYFLFLATILCSHSYIQAQFSKLPIGKKIHLTVETNNVTDVSILDQHMQMLSDMFMQSTLEVKAVTQNGYTLELIAKRMKLAFSMMGNEQKIDTDSIADKSDTLVAKAFEFINKPQTIVVENGIIVFRTKLVEVNAMNNNVEDLNKFFLTIEPNNYKQGYQWTDSTIDGGIKLTNKYTIMNVSASEVEVNVNVDLMLQSTTKQGGVDIKQNVKGFGTAKRKYNKLTSILINEVSSIDMNGTAETFEMTTPIIMKLKYKTTVQ